MTKGCFFFLMMLISYSTNGQKVQHKSKTYGDPEITRLISQKMNAASLYMPAAKVLPAPEQDCIAAIPLCDSLYTQTNSYVGQGVIQNEIDATASCLLSGEKNDVWYTFTVQTSGNLNFSITPLNGNDDYDWALFNLSNHVCSDIFSIPSLEVSCNYAPNLGCGGVTGPNNNTTGTCGAQNEPEVPVLAGEIYVINVSNFSSTQFGYTINFGASTATIFDDTPPQPTVTGMNCTDSTFIVSYPSELIDCSTIAPDGSDFIIGDLNGNVYPVLSATGIGCSGSQPYVNQLIITLHAANVPFPGFYLITQSGTDGNSFADKCGNFAGNNGSTDTVAYVNVLNDIQVDLGPDTAVCAADVKPLLNALNNGASFLWTYNGSVTGTNASSLQTSLAGTYTVTVTYGIGCNATDSVSLSYLPSFLFNLGNDTTICQGNPLPVLHTGISNAFNYQWLLNNTNIPGAQSDSLQTLLPGTYVAIVDSGNVSCPGTDTLTITEVLPQVFDLGNNLILCNGDSALVKAGINGPVNYDWHFNNSSLGVNADSIFVSVPGSYWVQVSTIFQCKSADTISVVVEQIPGKPTVYCPQKNGTGNIFNWTAVQNATGYEVSESGTGNWTLPSSGSMGLFHETASSVQQLFVRAWGSPVCPPGESSESLPCNVLVPNILTPNGDGINEVFFIKNLEHFPKTRVLIFNRWGSKIYSSENYLNNWDGDKNPDGVYFYELTLPEQETRTGTLTIIR